MKFLITGGAGFIGSNYLNYVINKYPNDSFVCIDKLTYAGNYNNIKSLEKFNNYKFYKVDITNKNKLDEIFKNESFDIVINFAAETHVDRSIENPGIFLHTNIIGTQVLLDLCLKYKVNRFHQISTDEVYGDLPLTSNLYFDENSILKPSSPYSVSKASADLLVNSYYRTYGLNTSISRCSNNYGPYQFPEKLIPNVITKILRNEEVLIYGNGKNIRNWIHVNDHSIAVDLIVRYGKVGNTYNISGNKEISNIDLVKIILSILGKSENLIKFVEDRKGHDLRYAINSSKIENELNWNCKYSFNEGIKDTIKWYIENQDY